MFLKRTLRDGQTYFADFVETILLAVPFLQFLGVCLPILLAAVLKVFLLPTTGPISRADNSNKQAPTHFAARTSYPPKKNKLVQMHRIPAHVVDEYVYRIEFLLALKQTSWNVF